MAGFCRDGHICGFIVYIICMYVGCHSVEHKLITDYYDKLVDIIPASDLSHYFVSYKIISLEDYKKIMRSSLPQEAAKLLLDSVSVQLQNGDNTIFNKMLWIMDHHGVTTAKELAQEIRGVLSAAKCESDVTSSSEQSKNIIIIAKTNIGVYFDNHVFN